MFQRSNGKPGMKYQYVNYKKVPNEISRAKGMKIDMKNSLYRLNSRSEIRKRISNCKQNNRN